MRLRMSMCACVYVYLQGYKHKHDCLHLSSILVYVDVHVCVYV